MNLIQAPGSFLIAAFQAFSPNSSLTTWIPFVLSGSLQLLLVRTACAPFVGRVLIKSSLCVCRCSTAVVAVDLLRVLCEMGRAPVRHRLHLTDTQSLRLAHLNGHALACAHIIARNERTPTCPRSRNNAEPVPRTLWFIRRLHEGPRSTTSARPIARTKASRTTSRSWAAMARVVRWWPCRTTTRRREPPWVQFRWRAPRQPARA